MNYKSSRGWRNNNPLNIRRGEEWQGLVAKQNRTDKEFCQFLNQTWGYRTGYKVMKSYARFFRQQGKPMTIEKVISRWAPANENNTRAYIDTVCNLLCLAPDTQLWLWSVYDTVRIGRLMAAMTCVECGCKPGEVNYGAIVHGIILAGGKEVKTETLML